MDAGVSSAVSTAVNTFSTDALGQLAVIIPIGIAVMITVVLVFKSLGWFKRLSGLRR